MAEDELKQVMEKTVVEIKVPQPVESKTPVGKTSCLWDDYDQEMTMEEKQPITRMTAVTMEIKFYNDSMRINQQSNHLIWWKENNSIIPKMSGIAKNILGTPATSVPSERIFSKAGELISSRRSSLKKETVDMMTFLNKKYL